MLEELKLKYKLSPINEKLMFINIGIFAIIALIGTIYFLFSGIHVKFFNEYLALPSDLSKLVIKPWTLITFFFSHFSFWHVLSNMIALYFFGRIFLSFFSAKHFLNYYMLGGLFSGLIFLASYNIFPALINNKSYLVGASGAVFAVLFGVTAKVPNYIFNLFGVLRIPLWVISTLYTILFISSIPYSNAGGELAHLGGAFLGYFYTYQFNKGNDIGSGFGSFMDKIVAFFTPKEKSKLKTVHKRKGKVAGFEKKEFDQFNTQKKIDSILDKISKSGYDSLTKEEKDFLFRAGK